MGTFHTDNKYVLLNNSIILSVHWHPNQSCWFSKWMYSSSVRNVQKSDIFSVQTIYIGKKKIKIANFTQATFYTSFTLQNVKFSKWAVRV